MIIDLRSDTVTQPTVGMLEAMATARTGDDVFGEDPTVNELEHVAAGMFGMEAALYCPTGTMSNQIAIKAHTQPGEEVVCDGSSHIYQYEGGGIAFNSGCQARALQGDRGRITAAQVEASINPDDVHKPRTSLVSLENTANRGGGSCYDIAAVRSIRAVCDTHGLHLHLDGARLFNALVARKETPAAYGSLFHSISICLNKGLGCPIGSILIGNTSFIRKAKRIRKLFGGGMRQIGYMAATGIYALQHHVNRMENDHRHAQMIGAALSKKEFTGEMLPVETNIIIFEVKPPYTPRQLADKLKEHQVLAIPISPTQVRMVLHLDISEQMTERVVHVIDHL